MYILGQERKKSTEIPGWGKLLLEQPPGHTFGI